MIDSSKKVVVIGGGIGSYMLLSELKKHTPKISAVVNVVDNGGSTGMLRNELEVLPPGDARRCLVALAQDSEKELLDLFNYRFDNTESIKGHSFGNLFLSALEKTTGSFAQAVNIAGKILKIKGKVIPATLASIDLIYTADDGSRIEGEISIEESDISADTSPTFTLEPDAEANPEAIQAISDADVVIIAPGTLYGSLAAVLMLRGIGQALKDTSAPVIYCANLVTQKEIFAKSVQDHTNELERYAGATVIDKVIYNTQAPSVHLLQAYTNRGEEALSWEPEKNGDYELIGRDLLYEGEAEAIGGSPDVTLIRHDGERLVKAIGELI